MVNKLIEEDCFIDSSERVVELVNTGAELEVNAAEVLTSLKALGLRYRKVKHVPLRANSDRNLVLR